MRNKENLINHEIDRGTPPTEQEVHRTVALLEKVGKRKGWGKEELVEFMDMLGFLNNEKGVL